MKKLRHHITSHWQAKLTSLALALVLWAVVRKSPGVTDSPSRRAGPEAHFDISTKR